MKSFCQVKVSLIGKDNFYFVRFIGGKYELY